MDLWRDVRYGWRLLRKSPSFAITAILTLGIGIGLTSAVYSVCDAMLWKPVALPHLESLAMVLQSVPGDADDWNQLTPADFDDIRRNSTALQNIAGWRSDLADVVINSGEPEGVLRTAVTANFFDCLEVRPAQGRTFEEGEDQPGREREVVLSNRMWKNRFGGATDVLDRQIRINGENYTIIGILPDSFDFPLATDIWVPNALSPAERTSRRTNMIAALARLKPGGSIGTASSEIESIATHLADSYPDTNWNRHFTVRPAHRFLVNYQREQYLIMLLSSGLFVLIIACVNVANLQFARGTGRLREVAVRIALGSSRWRIITQLTTENVLLSLLGALVGLALGKVAIEMIKSGMPAELQRFVLGWKDIQLDERALIFTLTAAVLSGILAGLAPALQSSRPNLCNALKEGGRAGSGGAGRHRLRNILVAAEIALAVVLLAGAGLMVRGFRAQVSNSAGLDPGSLLTLRVPLISKKYHEPHQITTFYQDVITRIEALPSIRSVAAVSALPYSGHANGRTFTIEGRPLEKPDDMPKGMYQVASPSYFATLHIPLITGRLLSESDGANSPKVAVISKRMASRWWRNQSPLGQHIRVGDSSEDSPWLTIVGVVDDIIHSPYDREPRRTVYVPLQQAPAPWMDIAVRTTGDPLLAARPVTAAIRAVDPEQSIGEIQTMERAIHNSAIGLNFMAVLMGVFGMIALSLSAIGVYGVMAHTVAEQNRDIGIRMALGAQKGTVLGMIFQRGMLTICIGLIVGLPLALGLSRILASVIYGVAATDVFTFVVISGALIVAASLAIYIPARRAMSIDPIVALRYE
jgi:putative ABC transport system permease protein